MHPPPPSPRTYALRRAAVAVLAVGALAALGAAIRSSDDDGAGPAATTSTETPSLDGTTTTAPAAITVVANAASLTVLVNKSWRLPPGWAPLDLVEPDVAFTFTEPDPKRTLRADAARALERLFGAAVDAGTPLAAVSGFRSEAKQADLFDLAVERFGIEEAERRSARPGHSEHQTGLAMDVTGADGTCAADPCFGGTPAARWLEEHAPTFGFVIRYPAGREDITGYEHEPWHLRYVGVDVARLLTEHGWVLEELPG